MKSTFAHLLPSVFRVSNGGSLNIIGGENPSRIARFFRKNDTKVQFAVPCSFDIAMDTGAEKALRVG